MASANARNQTDHDDQHPGDDAGAALRNELAALLAQREALDDKIRAVFEAMDEEGIEPPTHSDPVAEEESRLRQAAAEAENKYKRALADFQNFRRRSIENESEARRQGAISVIETMLPALDNFRMALDFDPEKTPGSAILEGVKFIRNDLLSQLARAGLEELTTEPGAEFDHELHAAVSDEPADGIEPGRVVRMLRSGYRVGKRVIRPVQVAVARSENISADAGPPTADDQPDDRPNQE
ncbi:MAG: nucleotide exchange factor GrpE [Phycisphaerales bacterium]